VIAPDSGDVRADGSIGEKVAWYAARVHGSLRIDGFRVDRESAKRVRGRHIVAASSEDGFRGSAFWTSEVVFPSAGCWRVTGTVGAARLSFVVRVR
jgi:hypothetical protein